MPVFIGDVLESCGGPILDLAGNKVKGVGIFGSSDDRNLLDAEFRTSGYLSVVDGDLEVYSGVTWDDANSWTKIASEFSLYPHIEVGEGDDETDELRAKAFVTDTGDNSDRYSFGVYDSTSDRFRKINGGTLESIIIHHFGTQLASYLQAETGNTDSYYTNPDSGVYGDINGDGIVGVSDVLEILSYFGNTASSIERDYLIHFGSNAWVNPNPQDLILNVPYENGGLWGSGGYNHAFNAIGPTWGNTTNVIGTTGGDDVAFVGNYGIAGAGSYIKIYRDPPPDGSFAADDPVADNMYAWAQGVTMEVVGGSSFATNGIYGTAETVLDGNIRLFARITCYDSQIVPQFTTDGTSYIDVNLSNQDFLASEEIQLQLHGGLNPYLGDTPYIGPELTQHIVGQWDPLNSEIKQIRITFWYTSKDSATNSTGATSQIETLDLGLKIESI